MDIVGDSIRDSGYGQHDANWLGFYDYFKEVCGLENEVKKLCGLFQISQNAGWWLPHQNICWISERHNILHRNSTGRLHKDGAIALAYPDGWGIYALNGVRMEKWQVMTPAEKIDPIKVINETNIERRRELIRKIGIERFIVKIGAKVLDKQGDYELLQLLKSPFEQFPEAKFLKMKNPSVPGVWHVEGVHPTCKTVEHAINWRTYGKIDKKWKPMSLT